MEAVREYKHSVCLLQELLFLYMSPVRHNKHLVLLWMSSLCTGEEAEDETDEPLCTRVESVFVPESAKSPFF